MIGDFARFAALALTLAASAQAQSPGDQLVTAIGNKDVLAVKSALAMGADPNYLDPEINAPPLIIALGTCQSAIALQLLEKGADPKVELADGAQHVPAMLMAMKCDDPAVPGAMIEHGADATVTDSYGNTALTLAASDGREDMVKTLLGKGVDVNQTDGRQRTALMWAVKTSNPSLLKLLLARGANPNLAVNGQTPLEAATRKGNAEVIAALRKAKAR